MNKQEHINKMIEEALNSVDDVKRAEPKPFLLTRINARMSKGSESVWEKAGWLIARPAVAFTGLCLIVLINVIVMMNNDSVNTGNATDQLALNSTDEFSSTVATIYDIENTQP
ncbi:MAG: hypothetical protein ABIR78_04060 [Ferruginibacter sp.]